MSTPMTPRARLFATIGRVALTLGFLAMLAAWISAMTATGVWLGFPTAHWFADATVMALLGIGGLVDALVHARAGE
ncbi:MAG: hypothetical protein BGP24_09660 [Lysobacterales bacterium 69-70]|nr:hypothetical protein [Xanthomonadaceae bacterium]ODU33221.1 MAG: hypothetical protein ABS97_12685 [Xanthomonadaceae bacterium SCN 69-320]ODV20453.1 MAG: hypothetical protein ABT27_06985 [Xanthomonadaceae bacterium SCN 69-25]OJZ00765.1 MAG: hypothetical protein BGP24_09660 [Xanthomonadales bacterium 69-70]